MQYIVVNLLASFFFLIGVALIYATTGTLNMTDLAMRLSMLSPEDLTLLKIGVVILALAFLTKSAMWPLGFWLPTTYSAASPPVAAMMVLMTKVGVYVLIRLWLLLFSEGPAAGFGFDLLLWGGLVTLAFGTIGILASQEPGRMAGYAAVISSGTLLAAVGYGQPALINVALFYLISSTLAVAAFLLLIELIERIRTPGAAMLALTMEAFAVEDKPEEPVGKAIPGALAFLGLAFACCALIITGLPPLSGFIAKFSLFHSLLNPTDMLIDGNRHLGHHCAGRAFRVGRDYFVNAFWGTDLLGRPESGRASSATLRSLCLSSPCYWPACCLPFKQARRWRTWSAAQKRSTSLRSI